MPSNQETRIPPPIFRLPRCGTCCTYGHIAYRTGLELHWNNDSSLFNEQEANHLLNPEYRKPGSWQKFSVFKKHSFMRNLLIAVLSALYYHSGLAFAQDPALTEDWSFKPPVVTPGKTKTTFCAIVLFYRGRDLANWKARG
jgi:hypothetical protein